MALSVDHFGSHVLDGAAEAERLVLLVEDGLFAETEIGERDVAIIV
jgi:hypothetical protein